MIGSCSLCGGSLSSRPRRACIMRRTRSRVMISMTFSNSSKSGLAGRRARWLGVLEKWGPVADRWPHKSIARYAVGMRRTISQFASLPPATNQCRSHHRRASRRNQLGEQCNQTLGKHVSAHARNFFDCIHSRSATAAKADVMQRSHIAATIAWILKRKLTMDPIKEEFIGDAEANRSRSRGKRIWTA